MRDFPKRLATAEDIRTVSYTHLDVYKRQILGRPTQTISFLASGKRLETPIPPQRTTLLLGRVA